MKYYKLALVAAILSTSYPNNISAQAVNSTKVAGTPVRVVPSERRELLDDITKALRENYVFPEKVKIIASDLRKREAAGDYDAFSDGSALAERLTRDLRSIGHDRHLGVEFVDHATSSTAATEDHRAATMAKIDRWAARENYGLPKIEVLDGNVGYIKVDGFMRAEVAGDTFTAAMRFIAETRALIIDLRGNKGGDPAMEQLAVSYFVEPGVHINDIYFRANASTQQYWSMPYLPTPRYLAGRPIYLLTDHDTVSAGEAFCYDLQQLKRAQIVGAATAGGANPGGLVPVGARFGLFVPTGRAINPVTKTNWEGVGVIPDVAVDPSLALRTADILALRDIGKSAVFPDDRDAANAALKRIEADLPPTGPTPPPFSD